MEGYCWNIAGHGLGAVAPLEAELRASSTDSSPTESPQTDAAGIEPTAQYAEWAAELEQTGADIDRTKVVRMIRLRDGRIAWLERGHPRKGLDHILEKQKRDAFEGTGVPREKIVELVFAAIEHGVVVGYSGRNRPVYEVVFDGETRRVAITIADDGGIIGAHPIPAKRKIRPNPHRR